MSYVIDFLAALHRYGSWSVAREVAGYSADVRANPKEATDAWLSAPVRVERTASGLCIHSYDCGRFGVWCRAA